MAVRKPNSEEFLDCTLDEYIAKRYIEKIANTKRRNIEFTLTFAQYKKLITTKKCYFTGIEMTVDYDNTSDSDKKPLNAFTLDRIDANIGYTNENTVACCHLMNYAKSGFESRLRTLDGGGELFEEVLKGLSFLYQDRYEVKE